MKCKLNGHSLCLNNYLSSSELNEARQLWILDNQRSINLNEAKIKHSKVNLNLKVDEMGVIRSYGRLKNVSLPVETKEPIFLQREYKFAEFKRINVFYIKEQNRRLWSYGLDTGLHADGVL